MDLSKPWSEYTFVGFDTETSGKYPLSAEIVEVAGTKWKNGKIIDTFQSLAKPTKPMGDFVISIHHITNEMVENSPPIKDVLPGFAKFIDGTIPIAQHAPFDMGFLALEFEKYNMPLPTMKVLDSCLLARKAMPQLQNHKLSTLVNTLKINPGTAHRALDDSRACLEVALKCMEKLAPEGTLEFMLQAQGGPLEWTRYSINSLRSVPLTADLVEAARNQWVMEITYKGGTQPGQPRKITPQGLVRNPQGDFLIAQCHRENTEKRFYVSQILSAKILD